MIFQTPFFLKKMRGKATFFEKYLFYKKRENEKCSLFEKNRDQYLELSNEI